MKANFLYTKNLPKEASGVAPGIIFYKLLSDISIMDHLIVKNQELEIHYAPNKGARTYHIAVPNTKKIKGRAGSIRINAYADNYQTVNRSLVLVTNGDKMLPINSEIRKALGKTAGDTVKLTAFLINQDFSVSEKEVLNCFEDAGVLSDFNRLQNDAKEKIISEISSIKEIKKQEEKKYF